MAEYFEDIGIGDVQSFGRYEVTREEAIDFARKFDPQPFHLSDEAAAETFLGRVAASGWHTCAMTMRMIIENFQAREVAARGGAGVEELRWLKPVYPGDTLRCESEVIAKRPSASRPELGLLRTQITVLNQEGAAVMRFISTGLIACRA